MTVDTRPYRGWTPQEWQGFLEIASAQYAEMASLNVPVGEHSLMVFRHRLVDAGVPVEDVRIVLSSIGEPTIDVVFAAKEASSGSGDGD